jgi:hypothetical protein
LSYAVPQFSYALILAFLGYPKNQEEEQVKGHHDEEVAEVYDRIVGLISQIIEVIINFLFFKQFQTLAQRVLNVNQVEGNEV